MYVIEKHFALKDKNRPFDREKISYSMWFILVYM